jgi:hypothetical protein
MESHVLILFTVDMLNTESIVIKAYFALKTQIITEYYFFTARKYTGGRTLSLDGKMPDDQL